MAAKNGLTTSAQFAVQARETDFVTRFGLNWDALRKIMGIMRAIRKDPGTKLVSYVTSLDNYIKTADTAVVAGKTYYTKSDDTYSVVTNPQTSEIANYYELAMSGGEDVAEGDEIPFTKFKVTPVAYDDVKIGKYGKSVPIEAVNKWGAEVAVQRTDEEFLYELQNMVLSKFYKFIKTGTLTFTATSFQKALATAKGKVLNKFGDMNRTVTEVVAFVNIDDVYDWIGDQPITVQSEFGLNYIKNFMGYSTVFLLSDKYIEKGKVIATPVDNIDLYYIDPSDSDFAALGLNYTVDGETNLIGFHVEGDYSRATGDAWALIGMTMWAEYLDGIAVATVSP